MDINQRLLEQIVPKMLLVFLGEKGLTQAEANHKADIIKEGLAPLRAAWYQTGAYNKVVSFEGKDVSITAFKKIDLVNQAQIEGDQNSLSAWLREGVKAKAQILNLITQIGTVPLQLEEDELPETLKSLAPAVPRVHLTTVSEDDIVGSWDIKTRAEYLSLEAQAAGIGKKIHGNGEIAIMRANLATMPPAEFTELKAGKGAEIYLVTNTELYTAEELEEAFMTLQGIHRTKESRLNYLKAQIKDQANLMNQELRQKYFEETQLATDEYKEKLTAHQNAVLAAQNEHNQYQSILEKRRLGLTNYVSKLRIVIPNDLQPILDSLTEKK